MRLYEPLISRRGGFLPEGGGDSPRGGAVMEVCPGQGAAEVHGCPQHPCEFIMVPSGAVILTLGTTDLGNLRWNVLLCDQEHIFEESFWCLPLPLQPTP